MDWNSIVKITQEAFRVAVNEWIGRARIQGGNVSGPVATLMAGCLVSDTNIEIRVSQALTTAKIPADISGVLAKALAGAWNDWARGFQIILPGAYPAFAAFPGPIAPPTPALPAPLLQGASVGEASLKAAVLTLKLNSAIRTPAARALKGSADQAIRSLATWVEDSFNEWKKATTLMGILGKGPVPTYAPPYVPVGPVVGGDNISAGQIFVGPRFGKVAI